MNEKLRIYSISSASTLIEGVAAIQLSTSRCIAVLNDCNMVIGVLSEGDVMRALLKGADVHAPIQRWIAGSFIFFNERDIARAWQLMRDRGITFIPVVTDSFELRDVVTLRDVLEATVLST